MYKNILVPIDGSETAARALQEAIRLARSLRARIRLVHVVDLPSWCIQAGPAMIEGLRKQFRSTGESVLHEARTAIHSADIEVDERMIEAIGEGVGEIVVAQAKEWPADLIICGTHGSRRLKRLLMGSDAEYIVSHSPVPVLLVRGPSSS